MITERASYWKLLAIMERSLLPAVRVPHCLNANTDNGINAMDTGDRQISPHEIGRRAPVADTSGKYQ